MYTCVGVCVCVHACVLRKLTCAIQSCNLHSILCFDQMETEAHQHCNIHRSNPFLNISGGGGGGGEERGEQRVKNSRRASTHVAYKTFLDVPRE